MALARTFAVSALFLASTVGAASVEKAAFAAPATCSCRGKGDCTCPKNQCKCRNCGGAAKAKKVFESLKGATETTRLPETARYDARGGVFI